MKTFPTSAAWCLGILFISVSLITTGSSEVVGPADPVVALTGDDIILPCSLKPSVSAEDMIVEWTRLNPKAEKVHLYLDSRDSFVDQFPSYRGRTSMFNEELKNGNVSLKLTNVTLSDAGRYRCFIQTLKKETTVQLLVGAVSQPVISIDGTKGWGVVLKCESGGWFPEPQMEWLDSSGTILPADGPPERHRDSEGLYTVRRHVTVNRTGNNRFTCRVNQLEINHLKETEIHVPDEVFPKSQVGLIVGLLIAVAVVVLAASAGVFMWRKHTEEKKCRKQLGKQSDARFVTRHKDHLIQKVSGGESIASELHQKDLIPDEMNSQISAAGTSQDQMRLLFKALEEAEDTTRVKSTFYKILLDLEPDVVKDLNVNKMKAPKKLRKENEKLRKENDELQGELNEQIQNLTGDLDDVTRERDELKEELRKAKEIIQSLSTSPGGQQKTQTPSQKSEGIEGMEMESLPGRKSGPGPGRKSAPEMKPLLAAGPQKEDLYDLERGGRDTTEFNYRETIPSGRKSGPEKEMEMKPLLGPGPQKDDLDELERGGRVTTEFNYVL